jgi:zinc protease
MIMRRLTLAVVLLGSMMAAPADERVHEQMLDNGLKVIVKEDHRAPIVTSQVWYKVGSSYEYGGLTGISHALEHMMFKGTEKYGPGKFSEIISANGGDENAFTSRDYTAYFQNLAKNRLAVAFELEADRMRNLTLPAEEYAKEIEVVKEERRLRTEDNPTAFTAERFGAAAYLASPYRNPVIGWMSDLDALTIDDVRVWYRKWYAPNNAILVVAGDVDPSQVFALADRYFGPLKPEQTGAPKPRAEPPQDGTKRILVKAPAKEPYLIMGYKATRIGGADPDWEPYALEMLSSILDGGSSARFGRVLVRGSEVAASADADYSAFTRLPEMFSLDGTPAKGHSVADLEQALRTQIERVKNDLVSPAELERVRNQVIASKVFEKDSVFYQAMQIGQLESVGLNWRLADQYVDRLSAITAEQVQAVARKYLTDDNLTVAVLDPQPLSGKQLRADTLGGTHVIR